MMKMNNMMKNWNLLVEDGEDDVENEGDDEDEDGEDDEEDEDDDDEEDKETKDVVDDGHAVCNGVPYCSSWCPIVLVVVSHSVGHSVMKNQ